MKLWLLILPIVILLGCDKPSNDQIRYDFNRTYPSAKIVIINPVEKTGNYYRVNIRFRDEGSDEVREDIFFYSKIGRQWVKMGRSSD